MGRGELRNLGNAHGWSKLKPRAGRFWIRDGRRFLSGGALRYRIEGFLPLDCQGSCEARQRCDMGLFGRAIGSQASEPGVLLGRRPAREHGRRARRRCFGGSCNVQLGAGEVCSATSDVQDRDDRHAEGERGDGYGQPNGWPQPARRGGVDLQMVVLVHRLAPTRRGISRWV
jgi:hypothetical protein